MRIRIEGEKIRSGSHPCAQLNMVVLRSGPCCGLSDIYGRVLTSSKYTRWPSLGKSALSGERFPLQPQSCEVIKTLCILIWSGWTIGKGIRQALADNHLVLASASRAALLCADTCAILRSSSFFLVISSFRVASRCAICISGVASRNFFFSYNA